MSEKPDRELDIKVTKAQGHTVITNWPCYLDEDTDGYCMAVTSDVAAKFLNKNNYIPFNDDSYPLREPAYSNDDVMVRVPEWSTDMNCSMRLVEKINEAGFKVNIICTKEKIKVEIWNGNGWPDSLIFSIVSYEGIATIKGKAIAICKAYLAWINRI